MNEWVVLHFLADERPVSIRKDAVTMFYEYVEQYYHDEFREPEVKGTCLIVKGAYEQVVVREPYAVVRKMLGMDGSCFP